MVKLDLTAFKYLSNEDFRVLVAVEMGMKNHELVPTQLINSLAHLKRGDVVRAITDCHMNKLVYHESKVYDGYRLTYRGYDFLSIRTHTKREDLAYIGNQIGTGKESDVFLGMTPDGARIAVKFHRLGRISFRSIKRNRNYHKNRKHASWLYLSRLAALKEFAYMKVLYEHNIHVPRPINVNRHVVLMEYLANSKPLNSVQELRNPAGVYSELMNLLVRLAEYGLVHCDFNEFNLMIDEEENITLIDFPQMVSTDHANAEMYFDRDVQGVRDFFKRRFGFDAVEYPVLGKVSCKSILDCELEASGFSKKLNMELEKMLEDLSDSDEESEERELQKEIDDVKLNPHSKDNNRSDSSNFCPVLPIDTAHTSEAQGGEQEVLGAILDERDSCEDDDDVVGESRKERRVRLRGEQERRQTALLADIEVHSQRDVTLECDALAAAVPTDDGPANKGEEDHLDGVEVKIGQEAGVDAPVGRFTRESVIHYRVKSQLDGKRRRQKVRIRNDFKLKTKRELKQQSRGWEIEM